jgi:membrane protein DedA with SNARE-associated domain
MRKAVLTLTTMLFVIGTIGTNIGPALVDERPKLVLLLSSRNRNLFGSVPYIDLLSYSVIGFCRVMLAGVALFFVGRWYGEKATSWVSGNVGEMPAIYRWTERAVDKAGALMVVLMPGSNVVCLLVGHRKMKTQKFVPLLMLGIAIKLAVLWRGGKLFEQQIKDFLNYIEKYQWWVVGLLFVVSSLQSARKSRPKSN